MIYFIQEIDGQDHFVKIGSSQTANVLSDLKRFFGRMSCLQVGNARRLKVLAVVKGTKAEEDMVKKIFKEAKVPGRQRGEWFDPVPELMDLISRLPKYPDLEALNDERGDEYLEYIVSLPDYKDPHRPTHEQQREMAGRLIAAVPMSFGRKLA